MNTRQQSVILSAELIGHSENAKRTLFLKNTLEDIDLIFKASLGSYKGHVENSFVVLINDIEELETLKAIAFDAFKQESVLYNDSNGVSHLLFNDGNEKAIGKMKEIENTQQNRETLENWTLLNNKLFTVM